MVSGLHKSVVLDGIFERRTAENYFPRRRNGSLQASDQIVPEWLRMAYEAQARSSSVSGSIQHSERAS